MQRSEIKNWLKENDPQKLEKLWHMADSVRKENVGDAVHLRGLLEISNYCVRKCAYCGISSLNDIDHYRMTETEIMECVHKAVKFGYGTIVIQTGEDYGLTQEFISNIIQKIKTKTPLAVTLSLGERPFADLEAWKKAGADRYLLRFETSNPELYQLIHPNTKTRFTILKELKQLGYEVGSGVMVGIPGQTYATLAQDIHLFGELDLDMIGIGPYIPHPNTPLGSGKIKLNIDADAQVSNTEAMTYKVVALTRLVCPEANIPSTTALATLNKINGREIGLTRGANVVMPNITPLKYREKYTIYPGKACINETAEQCQICLAERIATIGRTIGTGPGGRINWQTHFA
jgi:biotin synthase